ncbi:MAG: hypothetical protein KIS94_14255 [Chitinophagales bacterium]|nr:hypothetical protein [Chitinophagales bacterium]
MIIYGTRATHLQTDAVPDKCANCGTDNSVSVSAFQRYAHVFWIPLFPIGKIGASECSNCKQVLEVKDMPSSYRETYDRLKMQSTTPKWTFAGLGIIAALVLWGAYASNQDKKENLAYINDPKAGDIYEIKSDSKSYTLYKVDYTDADTVFVKLNEYESNKLSGLSDIKAKGDEAFTDYSVGFTKAELLQMLESGELYDIERK